MREPLLATGRVMAIPVPQRGLRRHRDDVGRPPLGDHLTDDSQELVEFGSAAVEGPLLALLLALAGHVVACAGEATVGGLPGEDDRARQVARVLGGVVDQVLELTEDLDWERRRRSRPSPPPGAVRRPASG